MFLLAQLHVESLASKRMLEDLELGIAELPTDLDAVYAKALKQIEHQAEWKSDLATKVLKWLVFAERPLSLDELIHAVGVNEADTAFHRDRLWTEQDITLACAWIVLVNPDSRTVRLTHNTAMKHLRSSKILKDSQSSLATTCLVYICFEDFSAALRTQEERNDRLKKHPFLRYAVDHWGQAPTSSHLWAETRTSGRCSSGRRARAATLWCGSWSSGAWTWTPPTSADRLRCDGQSSTGVAWRRGCSSRAAPT
jgi:hypothetical protein